jgi:hypothetical protein
MIDREQIRERFTAISPHLDERARRLLAATEARAAGYGGIAAVSQATGVAPSTIARGLQDLAAESPLAPGRVRQLGGGRKPLAADDPTLRADLLTLVEPDARADPMSPLRWTCKSLRRLADELAERGHQVSRSVIGAMLKAEKFSLQGNRKTREGSEHPDRDAQFDHINTRVKTALAEQQPVISVDTKKKELVGEFKNAGRTWRPQGEPEEVQVYDFLSQALGRAIPYGVYDLAANAGWVSVGMSSDTAAFAVQTIRRWWQDIARQRYPNAQRLVITADGGGSNGVRVRLWKRELQCLANELGIDIEVHHLPPGTSSRVDDWRVGFSLPVGRWWCFRTAPSIRIGLTPFPVAARQTGHADRPHPAFTCVVMPSRSAGQHGGAARHTGRASHRGTRPDIGGIRCLFVRCVSPTNVEDAVVHTNARPCRPVEPALG